MTSQLDLPTDVVAEMGRRTEEEAVAWFALWLHRRDELGAELATEHLAEALEVLASELRGEAQFAATARTRGLLLAATVLCDAAGGFRVGDTVTLDEGPAAQTAPIEPTAQLPSSR